MEGEEDVRRGLWTAEEDALLANYVAVHGEGRWNAVAREAGLKRTGKSCRLRWLNYLRPDVRRGNITAEEQLLILQLHSRWGNRWSKIAEQLPGRTDNEIKNYWRTRVQKHAKSLRCDPKSREFRQLINSLWVPLLLQKIHQHGSATAAAPPAPSEEREGGGVVATGILSCGPPHGSSPSTSPSSSSLVTSDELVSFDGEVAEQQPSSWPELLLDDIMWEGGEDDGLLDQPCSSVDDDIWCLQNI